MPQRVIPVSVEDHFAMIDMTPRKNNLFIHPFTLGNLSLAMDKLGGSWRFLWDLRSIRGQVYNDLADAISAIEHDPKFHAFLTKPGQEDVVRNVIGKHNPQIVPMQKKSIPKHNLSMDYFDEFTDGIYDLVEFSGLYDGVEPASMADIAALEAATGFNEDYQVSAADLGFYAAADDQYEQFLAELQHDIATDAMYLDNNSERTFEALNSERASILEHFFTRIGTNSLLNEFALIFDAGHVSVLPYHASSLHNVEIARDETVLLRPGRASAKYWRRFERDIAQMEDLLNNTRTREGDLEELLRANPLFLRGLNYEKIYAQVILSYEGKKRIPDIIAEPIGSEWCDIIELKKHTPRLLTGKDNRVRMASEILDVVEQLREYSRLFDDQKIAQFAKERYGFKCMKPKLVAIIGRDPVGYSPEQVRRAMTAYPDLEFVTYDALLRAAKKTLLI